MKNIKLSSFILTLTLLLISIGCIRNNEIIRGNGNLTEEARTVGSFSAVNVSGSFRILYSIADTFSLQINAGSNLLPVIETSVTNNRLTIRTASGFSILENQPVIVRITAPSISEIYLSGSSQFICSETIETNNFKAGLSGSSLLETGLIANQITTNISGSGSVKITNGESQSAKYNISGSATIHAIDHISCSADIKISGSGKVWVHVTDHLGVNISGSGEVNYTGNPTIDSSISGSGRIIKL